MLTPRRTTSQTQNLNNKPLQLWSFIPKHLPPFFRKHTKRSPLYNILDQSYKYICILDQFSSDVNIDVSSQHPLPGAFLIYLRIRKDAF